MRIPNLLDDDIIPVFLKDQTQADLSLPAALAALSQDLVDSFRDVKRHQLPSVEFLVSHLGVLGVDLGNEGAEIEAAPETWKRRLLALAPASAWNIWNPDPSVAAFMQPGISAKLFEKAVKRRMKYAKSGNGAGFSPDEIGLQITSKNHTVKFSSMAAPTVWNWVVALVEAQTMSGYDGKSLYGIPRMNQGLSTRFKVGTYTDLSVSGKWKADVRRILDSLPEIYREHPHFSAHGKQIGALWTVYWGEDDQVGTQDLHPLYVDVSRRIRLCAEDDGRIFVVMTGTSSTRVPDLDLKGAFGDPWAPLVDANYKLDGKKAAAAALTSLSPTNISLRLLARILVGNEGVQQSRMQRLTSDDHGKKAYFCLDAFLRGQGETNGSHHVTIPVPAPAAFRLGKREGRDELGAISTKMLSLAEAAEQTLRAGVFRYVQAAADKVNFRDDKQSVALFSKVSGRLTLSVSNEFFQHLWAAAETKDLSVWIGRLKELALQELELAFDEGGSKAQLSFKARALATSDFHRSWNNLFNKEAA